MNRSLAFAVLLGLVAILFVHFCTYTVEEYELVVEREFKKVKGEPIREPGLKFKLPWVEARKFEDRWLAWDGDPNQITTRDKRYILIDVFARWKIADPLVFIEKLGDEYSAQSRLDDILDSATRNVIANHNLIESIRSSNRTFAESDEEKQNAAMMATSVSPAAPQEIAEIPAIEADTDTGADETDTDEADTDAEGDTSQDGDMEPGAIEPAAPIEQELVKDQSSGSIMVSGVTTITLGRQKLTELILQKASAKARTLGIELKDVRLKRIDYIPSVQQSVFERMISERQKVAARLRSQGDGLSAQILGRKEKDLKKIRSNAYRLAEEIKGDADAQAARIYAQAYEKDPELYRFLKTLESYRQTVDGKTWLLLSTESDWARYLKTEQ